MAEIAKTPMKRQRGPNWQLHEKITLAELVEEYRDVIENKATNAVSCAAKAEAWEIISQKLAAATGISRVKQNIINEYNGIKSSIRKKKGAEARGRRETGGGAFHAPRLDPAEEIISRILGVSAEGLPAIYGSDALFIEVPPEIEHPSGELESKHPPAELEIEHPSVELEIQLPTEPEAKAQQIEVPSDVKRKKKYSSHAFTKKPRERNDDNEARLVELKMECMRKDKERKVAEHERRMRLLDLEITLAEKKICKTDQEQK